MQLLTRLLFLLLLVVVFLAGMMFTFQNTEEIALDLFFVQLPPAALSVWVLTAFAIGGVLGVVFTLGVAVKVKSGKVAVQRKLNKAEKTVQQLEDQVAQS